VSDSPDPLAALALLDGVFETIEAARASVDSLRRESRVPANRARAASVSAESLRRSAWASVALEDRAGALDAFVAPLPDPLSRNVLGLYAEIGGLADAFATAPGQALARMHVRAVAGIDDPAPPGRPVDDAAARRLEALVGLLAAPTRSPALVAAAVAHAEILDGRIFGATSGVVARLVSRCVLVARGVDPSALAVPEEGHLRMGRAEYAAAQAAYATGTAEGVRRWLVHCAEALARGADIARTEVLRAERA